MLPYVNDNGYNDNDVDNENYDVWDDDVNDIEIVSLLDKSERDGDRDRDGEEMTDTTTADDDNDEHAQFVSDVIRIRQKQRRQEKSDQQKRIISCCHNNNSLVIGMIIMLTIIMMVILAVSSSSSSSSSPLSPSTSSVPSLPPSSLLPEYSLSSNDSSSNSSSNGQAIITSISSSSSPTIVPPQQQDEDEEDEDTNGKEKDQVENTKGKKNEDINNKNNVTMNTSTVGVTTNRNHTESSNNFNSSNSSSSSSSSSGSSSNSSQSNNTVNNGNTNTNTNTNTNINTNNTINNHNHNHNHNTSSIPQNLTDNDNNKIESQTPTIIDVHQKDSGQKDEEEEKEEVLSGTTTTNNENENDNDKENENGIVWFDLYTGNARIDQLYQLVRNELSQTIRDNNDNDAIPAGGDSDGGGGRDQQLGTRDISYAIELGAGFVEPQIAMNILQSCTERVKLKQQQEVVTGSNSNNNTRSSNNDAQLYTVWYQDQSPHFGGWPNLSDSIIGARGAWSLYLYTGNSTFLEWAFETTVKTLFRAEHDHYVSVNRGGSGLFHGCSSFTCSNSGYPTLYHNKGTLVGKTKAFSTNVLYYNGYQLASQMGEILMEHSDVVRTLHDRANVLKKIIRDQFWMEQEHHYGYMFDEQGHLIKNIDALGTALALLTEKFEANHRITQIFERSYQYYDYDSVGLPIPSIWPQFDFTKSEHSVDFIGRDTDTDNTSTTEGTTTTTMAERFGGKMDIAEQYHNGRIWPFINSYYGIAAARYGQSEIFYKQLFHLIELSEQSSTSYTTFAEVYNIDNSFPPPPTEEDEEGIQRTKQHQLLSDSGYVGMIYQGIFGMKFLPDCISFAPTTRQSNKDNNNDDDIIPIQQKFTLNETISLVNVKYRKAILDIYIIGYGNVIEAFKVNGQRQNETTVNAYVTGRQVIEITVVH